MAISTLALDLIEGSITSQPFTDDTFRLAKVSSVLPPCDGSRQDILAPL